MSVALSITRKLHEANEELHRKYRLGRMRGNAAAVLKKFSPPYRLHLGCGYVYLDGWINSDLGSPGADLAWDLRAPFPLPDGSCQYIFHEHLLEHFSVEAGVGILKECRRLLRPGGVLRIAMPSLKHLIEMYGRPDWREQEWLKIYTNIASPAEMLNVSLRWWGHSWLYDEDELRRRLREAGFQEMRSVQRGESSIEELRNRESRPDSLLVMEAVA